MAVADIEAAHAERPASPTATEGTSDDDGA
jgi:hypothetical protein